MVLELGLGQVPELELELGQVLELVLVLVLEPVQVLERHRHQSRHLQSLVT